MQPLVQLLLRWSRNPSLRWSLPRWEVLIDYYTHFHYLSFHFRTFPVLIISYQMRVGVWYTFQILIISHLHWRHCARRHHRRPSLQEASPWASPEGKGSWSPNSTFGFGFDKCKRHNRASPWRERWSLWQHRWCQCCCNLDPTSSCYQHICHQDANALMLGEFPVVMDLVGSVEAAKAAKQQVFTETASMSAISMRISVSKSIISISYARPQSRW